MTTTGRLVMDAMSFTCLRQNYFNRQLCPPPQSPLGIGTDKFRQIERAKNFLISLCRGMASLRPVCGLVQME